MDFTYLWRVKCLGRPPFYPRILQTIFKINWCVDKKEFGKNGQTLLTEGLGYILTILTLQTYKRLQLWSDGISKTNSKSLQIQNNTPKEVG